MRHLDGMLGVGEVKWGFYSISRWEVACTLNYFPLVSIPVRVWGASEPRWAKSLSIFGFQGAFARTIVIILIHSSLLLSK